MINLWDNFFLLKEFYEYIGLVILDNIWIYLKIYKILKEFKKLIFIKNCINYYKFFGV